MPHPPTLASAFGRGGLLVLERLLAVVGVLLLGLYAAACAELGATQRAAGRSFDRALATRLALEQHDQSEWAPGRVQRFEIARQDPVTPLGRLEIPDAGVSVMILDGTGDSVLDRAVGRIEGTARLGEVGNLGIAGHRDGIFRGLRHLEVGDSLTLTSLDGVSHYLVDTLRVVAPRDVEVLDPTPHKSLTLVTCYPFYFVGDAPERFIVHAREARFEPWSETRPPHLAAR
jgi:sortase A